MADELDIQVVDEIVAETGPAPEALIPVLSAIQKHFGYLPEAALTRLADVADMTAADIAGVASFYTHFRHRPVGEHMISVCIGTACHVKGAEGVLNAFRATLGIGAGDDTDPDGAFTVQAMAGEECDTDPEGQYTVQRVACLGCCTLAPVVQIDDVTYGHVTPARVNEVLHSFLERDADGGTGGGDGRGGYEVEPGTEIRVGLGSCCIASGSGDVHTALLDELGHTGARVPVKRVGCVGICHRAPLVEIVYPNREPVVYARVDADGARDIVRRHFAPRNWIRRGRQQLASWLTRLYSDERAGGVKRYSMDVRDPQVASFLDGQRHLATEHCGVLDPLDLEEYEHLGGFKALREALGKTPPEQVVERVLASGLRGRGGAGFPTGRKWAYVRRATETERYIVCNGDEGDPGAFMDRMLLESYPYGIIEGMIIASWAVGTHQGFLYIRAEYPLAVQRVREALEGCRKAGYLGDDILGTGHSLDLRVLEGAGAFVCGEETALLASAAGRRGMPSARPPFPAQAGFRGKPTLVNNVETYALVPWIVGHGSDAFGAMGTDGSRGTKVFALAGKIARGGLIEVPMGITLRQVVEDVGGGIGGGRTLKAIQVGGPSGGCVPTELADTPVDYEALLEVGAMMGSGGLVVLDDGDCMVDIARYFLTFTQDQSCGKCTFCRVGTRQMLDILERLCEGDGRAGDIEELEHLADVTRKGSLCGLGKTAPNPVLSTIRYFREEYEAHIAGRCPAGSCKALITYIVNDACIGCTKCARVCPTGAVVASPYRRHEIDPQTCVRCDGCRQVCPNDAIRIR